MNAFRASSLAVQVLVLALMGACAGGGGGGGGGGGFTPPPPPVSPPVPFPPMPPIPPLPPAAAPGSFPATSSTEFQNNWGLDGINAQAAWQYENAHGEGVLIGVIDDGIHPNHPELQGRIDPDSTDIVPGRNGLTTNLSHGSELSALIAGNFNGSQTVGVAYEASILAIRADNGFGTFSYVDLANAVNYAVAQGVDIINFSLGSTTVPSGANGDAYRRAIADATAAGVIIVVSAGNDGPNSPRINYPGYFGADASTGNGLIIAAGGTGPDGAFNVNSNPARDAANFYITAPGWEIIVPDFGPPGVVPGYQRCWPDRNNCTGLVEIQGTSYASPHVAGAAAILMSAFPGMTPQQVVELLLATTDDIGAAGVDQQTGRGALNLARAFQPVGTLSVPLMAAMPSANPSTMLGAVGPAFGDGLSDDAGEWATVGFDRFERTFKIDLANNWARAPGGPALGARAPALWRSERGASGALMQFAPAESVAPDSLRLPVAREDIEQSAVRIESQLPAGFTLSFAAHGARAADADVSEPGGHLSFVNADTSLRLTRRMNDVVSFSVLSEQGEARAGLLNESVQRSATAAQASFDLGVLTLDATFGQIDEEQGLLGLVWSDSFGETPRGETRFTGLSGHFDPAAGWRVNFEAETGLAELAQSGWLRVGDPLRTSAFGAELLYFGGDALALSRDGRGMVTFSISQPMRVESGSLMAHLPSATNYGRRSMVYETRAIDPSPSGREVRFGIGYRYFEGDVISGFGEALYVLEPGHIARAEPESILRFGLRMRR